jgi:hypothetical protein
MPLPPKLISVDFYDLKSMSSKFGNDIFIIFEGEPTIGPFGK